MRILLIEDEPKIAAFIKRGLGEQAHAVDIAQMGQRAAIGLCLSLRLHHSRCHVAQGKWA
ncbi:MAG: hypothetical protein R2867_31805 [Caldilineaceae bacterium]